ncbi:MAG: T9SS type A sorting domain-containing protein [Ignavibacteria bacterium]
MIKKILIVSALLFIGMLSFSNVINIPGQYTSIQAGINASANGDTVLVEPGVYFENINFRGKRIVLTGRYYINNDPSMIINTIINGSTPIHPDTASCVIISSGEDSTTVLQGFTLTGGTGTRWNDEHAIGNYYREGGGILIQYSSPVIQNNIIRNNQAINTSGSVSAGGGGIRMGDSNPKVLNNIIMQNQGIYGPGIVMNYSGGTFKNNIVCLNSGGQSFNGGGAFWILSNSPAGPRILENNTIMNNSAATGTGGVLCISSTVTISNNIIRGNTSPGNTQVLGGGTVTYCNIQNGFAGTGNISSDPLFADSNYILQTGSPCVDAGDSSIVYNDPQDPNNIQMALYPSRGGLRNDMGAYGGPLRRILTNGLIGIHNNGSEIPRDFALYQNYPNPFNPSTMINFDIVKSGSVKLIVFNVTGKEVSRLIDGYKPAGKYSMDFIARDLPSGIYFYTLTSGGYSATRKMILLK